MSNSGDDGRRAAAVVLAIFRAVPRTVLFVERAAHLRHHPGQIGLPGGALDPEDGGDLQLAAMRELHEEVGIVADRVRFVGVLPTVSPRINRFDVTPFVAVVEPGPLRVDPSETAGTFVVPLDIILSDALTIGRVGIGRVWVETPLLEYGGRRIWGMTGRVLHDFANAWNRPDGVLRAHVEAALA